MKRHISIFALLLSAFAAVGLTGTAEATLRTYYKAPDGSFKSGEAIVSPLSTTTPTQSSGKDITAYCPVGQKLTGWYYYAKSPSGSDQPQGQSLGTANPLNVKIADGNDYWLCAHFAWITYKVKYDADGGTGAPSEVTGNSYNSDFPVSSAVPTKNGYTFAGWKADTSGKTYEKGAVVAGSELCKSDWHDDNQTVNLTAQWTKEQYTISTVVEPSGAGSVTGAGTYDFGTQVTLTATANSGWQFEKWKDGSTDNPRTVTVGAAAATYTAVFKQLTVAKPTVTKSFTYDGTQKTCASAGSHYTVTGNTGTDAGNYTFTATLTDGYAWSDGGSTEPYTVNWTIEPKRAAALTLSSNEFSYTGGEQGPQVTCVNCAEVSGSVKTGTQVGTYYVKAKPSKNYAWSDGLTDERNFAWRIVEGHFSATIAPGEGGTGGSTVNYSTSQNPLGTQISLPMRKGYEIESWTASGYVGTAPTIIGTTLTIPARTAGNFTMTPTWKAKTYTITLRLKDGESYGLYKGPRNYQLPKALTFDAADLNQISIAVKDDDSIFQGYFTDSGVMVYDAQGRNVKGAKGEYWTADYPTGTYCHDGDLTLSASWGSQVEKYQITVNVDPAGVGSVEGDGIYEKGSNAVLKATENAGSGYSFCCWTNSATGLFSNDNPWTFTVTADATYTAVFTGKVYKVSFVDDDESGTPPKSVYRQFGQPYGELPKSTYSNPTLLFSRWLDDDEKPVTAETIVSIAGNHVLHADTPLVKTKFDVIFIDKDGTNGAITNKDVATETPVPPLAPTTWTRKYYTLAGWDPPLPQTVGMSDLEFTAVWWSIGKDVLDCTNLDFEAIGNWKPTYDVSAEKNWCMQMNDCQGTDNLTATLDGPGTLTFNWKSDGETKLRVKFGDDEKPLTFDGSGWKTETLKVPSTAKFPLTLQFFCQKDEFQIDGFCAIDKVTWDPGVVTKYTLEVATAGNGTVAKSPDENDYEAGAQVTISATPEDGYQFEKWSDGSTVKTRQIIVESNATYVATFAALPPDEYTVEVTSAGNGTVARDPDQAKYVKDTSVTISATPNAGYAFEKWSDGSVAASRQITVISNAAYSASFTNCVYEIMLNANGGTGGPTSVTVTYGEALPTLDSLPSRAGYALIGYFDAVSGGVKYYNADGTGARNWDKTAGAELYAQWENDVGALSRILNCDNLRFKSAVEGWEKCEDPEICVAADDPCLKSETKDAAITAKIKGKGTLTFLWKGGAKPDKTVAMNVQLDGRDIIDNAKKALWFKSEYNGVEYTTMSWDSYAVSIDTGDVESTLVFLCRSDSSAGYLALDHVTWTPEGEHPKPTEADKVTISSAAVSDGKFTLSFQSDERFDYNLLTNANLLINSWGVMTNEVGTGETITFEPQIIEGQPQLFYKVETIQRKD